MNFFWELYFSVSAVIGLWVAIHESRRYPGLIPGIAFLLAFVFWPLAAVAFLVVKFLEVAEIVESWIMDWDGKK